LALTPDHEVTVEYALSTESMVEAATLAHPHLIICPFLTSYVPAEIYTRYVALVIHPGAPGDGGPSAIDFLIIGEDGTDDNIERVMAKDLWSEHGRSHWGVTVLQANAEYDAGPVWAWEQYSIDIDNHNLTKSGLYRGAVTRAALTACLVAIDRVQLAAKESRCTGVDNVDDLDRINPKLEAKAEYKTGSATTGEPFLGGHTTPLPLLKAAQRDFDVNRHCALMISRLIRASDSQPGCLTEMFTPHLYIYGGLIEDGDHISAIDVEPGTFIGIRNDAVCFKTVDGRGIWITHGRRVKRKTDPVLWPKVPAIPLFVDVGIVNPKKVPQLLPSLPPDFSKLDYPTFQEIFVEYDVIETGERIAYLNFNFYNGAMSTNQCREMCAALRSILDTHTDSTPLSAVVLLGGTYFSNGIHLNVIEADLDIAIHAHVSNLVSTHQSVGQWKIKLDLSPTALATARANELAEMSKDFWSPRSIRYHSRRSNFVRKVKPSKTPLRFAQHRRKAGELDEEETESFDKIETFAILSKEMQKQALQQAIEQLKVQARRASTPGTVNERDRRQMEMMFSCYYNAE